MTRTGEPIPERYGRVFTPKVEPGLLFVADCDKKGACEVVASQAGIFGQKGTPSVFKDSISAPPRKVEPITTTGGPGQPPVQPVLIFDHQSIRARVPQEMQAASQWLIWSNTWLEKSGKWAKQPRRLTAGVDSKGRGRKAYTVCGYADSLHTLDAAIDKASEIKFISGVGFALIGTGIVAIDVDGYTPESPWANEIIDRFEAVGAYMEVSPGGRGVRIFLRGKLAAALSHKFDGEHTAVESWDSGRYVTVTGVPLARDGATPGKLWAEPGEPERGGRDLPESQEVLDWLQDKYRTTSLEADVQADHRATLAAYKPPRGESTDDGDYDWAAETLFHGHMDGLVDDYNHWIKVGMALVSRFGPRTGLDLWDRWSQRGANYEAGVCQAKSATFKKSGLSFGSFVEWARQAGAPLQAKNDPNHPDRWRKLPAFTPASGPEYVESLETSLSLGIFKPDIVWPDKPPFDDLHRSKFLSLMFGGRVLYCEQNSTWLMYESGRWRESRKLAFQLAKSLPRTLADIGSNRPDSKDWYEAAADCSNIKAVESVLRWMQTDCLVDVNDLDSNPWLLNLKNGTLDLKTNRLRPHDPRDLLSKQSPVEYDPQAVCPLMQSTLEMFQPCPEMRELILQFAGYSLTGVITDLSLPIWYGPMANNGKSTISEALRCVLGPDYSSSLDVEFLIGNKSQSSDEYHIAQLKGVRHVLLEEPDPNATLRPKALKALVDNRTEMTGRHPHGRPFRFKPSWKCHVVTNHKPNIKATDNGTWRRLLLVPFDVSVDPGIDKKDFKQELFGEASGILNLLTQACMRWQERGTLFVPESVRKATAELRSASDAIGQFVDDCCIVGSKDYRTKPSALYSAYVDYMQSNPDLGEPQSTTAFGRYFGERFKKNSDRSYTGIGLRK